MDKRTMKLLSELNLVDRFLFDETMEDRQITSFNVTRNLLSRGFDTENICAIVQCSPDMVEKMQNETFSIQTRTDNKE